MKNIFESHFLKTLTKEEMQLLKERGPKARFKDKFFEGVEFFEEVHSLNEKGQKMIQNNSVIFCKYYLPLNTCNKLRDCTHTDRSGNKIKILVDIEHIPSVIIYNTKFFLNNSKEDQRIKVLTSRYCASELIENLKEKDYDLILPVSHTSHNFSSIIAFQMYKILLDFFNIDFDNKFIKPIREVKRQIPHSYTRRQMNVEGAFKIIKEFKNKNIILVDDVITTGATICEYTRLLSNLNEVDIYVMFKTINLIKYDENSNPENSNNINFVYDYIPLIT